MKNLVWRLSLMAAFAALTWSGSVAVVSAAEEDREGPGDRLERLERRVNEMAQRQGPAAMPGPERLRQPGPLPGLGRLPQPEPGLASAVPATPPAEMAQHAWRKIADMVKLCCFVGFIFNILVAIWIFSDIRKRGEGSGIFIALALLAGNPTAIIYAIVRIGDKKT